jgi:hypothetical protein
VSPGRGKAGDLGPRASVFPRRCEGFAHVTDREQPGTDVEVAPSSARLVRGYSEGLVVPEREAAAVGDTNGSGSSRAGGGEVQSGRRLRLAAPSSLPGTKEGTKPAPWTGRDLDQRVLPLPRRLPTPRQPALSGGCVMPRGKISPVCRVRESRTHGLKGGRAPNPRALGREGR